MNKTLLTGLFTTVLLAACNQQEDPTATANDAAVKSTETVEQAMQRARKEANIEQAPAVSANQEAAADMAPEKAEATAQAAADAVQKADAQIKEADEKVRDALKKAE